MEFFLNTSSFFTVPFDLVAKHLKLSSENELKFILFVLAHPNQKFSNLEISEKTGIDENLIEDCYEYWKQKELIRNEKSIKKPQVEENVVTENKQIKTSTRRKMLRPDSIYIAQRSNESEEIASLLSEAQSILGKTLSPALSSVFLIAHDDYLLPCEVILMLLSYCASVEKTSTSYIENMVKQWYEDDVISLTLAENKIKELGIRNLAWKEFSSCIGINNRNPVKSEQELSYMVLEEMKFSSDMIKLCYEECVEATGKYQIKYMKKIFESWYEKGYKNPFDVNNAKQNANADKKSEKSYDLSGF